MDEDRSVSHVNNLRRRATKRLFWKRVLAALWPLSSHHKDRGKSWSSGREQLEKHIRLVCVENSYDSVSDSSDGSKDLVQAAQVPRTHSRAELDTFVRDLERIVLTPEDHSLGCEMDAVWESTMRRYGLGRSATPRVVHAPPTIDEMSLQVRPRPDQRAVLTTSSATAQSRRARYYHFTSSNPSAHLRGGGHEMRSGRKARTDLPPRQRKPPLPDDARPGKLLWWLAGGNISRTGLRPTIGELRVRKEVEEANRDVVGFAGTLTGRRSVGGVGMIAQSPEMAKENTESGEVAETCGEEIRKAKKEADIEMNADIRQWIMEQIAEQMREIKAAKGSEQGAEAKDAKRSTLDDEAEVSSVAAVVG